MRLLRETGFFSKEAVAQALVNAQAEAHFGGPWNAKGRPQPNGYRNGFKARGLQTVAGGGAASGRSG